MSYEPPSRQALESLARRILGFSKADQCRVVADATWRGNTRFAASEITTAGVTTDTEVDHHQHDWPAAGLDDHEPGRRCIAPAARWRCRSRIARLSPEDPELMPELAAQRYTTVDAYDATTAPGSTPMLARRRRGACSNCREVKGQSLLAAGFIELNAGARAVATSNGLFAYHAATDASMSTTVRTPDGTGSGWAAAGARAWSDIDAASLGTLATRKALASRNPVGLEPGPYTVILEPQAVADLVPMMMGSFDARQADEGRSPFSAKEGGTKIGQKVADERVTITSDAADPNCASVRSTRRACRSAARCGSRTAS